MTRRSTTLLVASLIVAGLIAVGLWLPVPYVALLPGPVTDTLGEQADRPLIEVEGRPVDDDSAGRLLLTTVEQRDELTLVTAVRQWLADDVAVVPEELQKPPGKTDEELEQEYVQEMLESQEAAISAALHYLRIPATVRVDRVIDGAPADGRLEEGDVLLAVDGEPVDDAVELRLLIREVEPGTEVTVRYRRDGTESEVRIPTAAAQDSGAVIGIEPEEDRPFEVDIALEGVGGPSAGLMFSLGVVDMIDPGDLTGGRTIAGTGTIEPDGDVGAIGGIAQKMFGARRAGATIFLVPASNCPEARGAVPAGLRLVKVETLSAAVDDLKEIADGGDDAPTC